MNYLSYLKGVLNEDYVVTEELNFDYNGNGVAVIIKYLTGNNFQDSTVIPIQLSVYTDDVPATRADMEAFTKSFNDVAFVQGFEYIRQFYSTPMVLANFDPTGTNYTSQIVVSGTLVISSNISDIKKVKIDGTEYVTTLRYLNYTTNPDSQRRGTGNLNKTNIKNAMMKFTCSLINKGSTLGEKVRRIRLGQLPINTTFDIELTFTDNDYVENYTMKLDSISLNSENQSLPVLSLSFIE